VAGTVKAGLATAVQRAERIMRKIEVAADNEAAHPRHSRVVKSRLTVLTPDTNRFVRSQ
jgi:hypothetical protein